MYMKMNTWKIFMSPSRFKTVVTGTRKWPIYDHRDVIYVHIWHFLIWKWPCLFEKRHSILNQPNSTILFWQEPTWKKPFLCLTMTTFCFQVFIWRIVGRGQREILSGRGNYQALYHVRGGIFWSKADGENTKTCFLMTEKTKSKQKFVKRTFKDSTKNKLDNK